MHIGKVYQYCRRVDILQQIASVLFFENFIREYIVSLLGYKIRSLKFIGYIS